MKNAHSCDLPFTTSHLKINLYRCAWKKYMSAWTIKTRKLSLPFTEVEQVKKLCSHILFIQRNEEEK